MTLTDDFSDTEVSVTGTAWMGAGVGSIQSSIEEMFKHARREIHIAVYEITQGSRGFLDKIKDCLNRGIRVTMIVNRFDEKSPAVKNTIKGFLRFRYFNLYDFTAESTNEDLHAKIIVIDRLEALVGSANLTWRGLAGNHELSIIVKGKTASTISSLLDKLCIDRRSRHIEIRI